MRIWHEIKEINKVFANTRQSFCPRKLFAEMCYLLEYLAYTRMASASVVNCFKGLINGMIFLVGSTLTNLDLTWNLINSICFISQTMAIRWNMAILDNVWCYFKPKNSILINLNGFHVLFNLYHLESVLCLIMTKFLHQIHTIKTIIIILFFVCFIKNQMLFLNQIYNDYNFGIFFNVSFDNFGFNYLV